MSATYITPTYPDMSRWHDPANDCPNKGAFLDALLAKQKLAPQPKTEPPRCAYAPCNGLMPELRQGAKHCSRKCQDLNVYQKKTPTAKPRSPMKHGGQCRKCGTARPAGERCQKCRAEAMAKRQIKQPDLLAEAMALPADAELSRSIRMCWRARSWKT